MGGSTDGGGSIRKVETDGMRYLHDAAAESGLVVVSKLYPKYDTGYTLLENFGSFQGNDYELHDKDSLKCDLILAPKKSEYDLSRLNEQLGGFVVSATGSMEALTADEPRSAHYTKRRSRLSPAIVTIREDLGEHPVTYGINLRIELGAGIPQEDSHSAPTPLFAATSLYLFPNEQIASRAELFTNRTAEAALKGRKLKLVRKALTHQQAFQDLVPKLA